MGDVIQLDDYRYPWREVSAVDGTASTLRVYHNASTGELDVVQMNDDDESVRTIVPANEARELLRALLRLYPTSVTG